MGETPGTVGDPWVGGTDRPQELENMKGLSITTSQVPGGTVTHVVWQIANPQVGIEGEGVVFVGSWRGPGGGEMSI